MKARVLSLAALLAASVPLLLTECSYDITCDTTSAAIVLLAPGDKVELRGRACVTPDEQVFRPINVSVEDTNQPPAVELSLVDSIAGHQLSSNGNASLELAPVHCDEGFMIRVESKAAKGSPITTVLRLDVGAHTYEQCHVALEVP